MYQKTIFDVREQTGVLSVHSDRSLTLLPQLCWSIIADFPEFPCRMSDHPCHELIYVRRGTGTVQISESEFKVSQGDLILVNPGEMHRHFSDKGNTCVVNYIAFVFGDRWMEILTSTIGNCRLPNLLHKDSIAADSFLNGLNFYVGEKGPFWQQLVSFHLGAFFMQLLHMVEGHSLSKIEPFGLANRVALILHAYPKQRFTVAELARRCSLSRSYFCRTFKKETGESPSHFVLRQKIRQAQEMLRLTSRKISDIAYSLGFDDEFYFSKVFKRYVGKSPSQYRDRSHS